MVSPAFAFGRNDSRHSSSPAASHQLTNTYIRTRSLRYEKNYLTLILPSLLSGCAGISGSNNVAPSDTPALVFVDGQISESAGVLALTQQRLSPPKITPPESQRARDSKNSTSSQRIPTVTFTNNKSEFLPVNHYRQAW